MTAAQDALRLTAEAIVEAAALDGDRTAADATVWQRTNLRFCASVDLTIGRWYANATAESDTPDDAVRDCLRALDTSLARSIKHGATSDRVREALAAALEVP